MARCGYTITGRDGDTVTDGYQHEWATDFAGVFVVHTTGDAAVPEILEPLVTYNHFTTAIVFGTSRPTDLSSYYRDIRLLSILLILRHQNRLKQAREPDTPFMHIVAEVGSERDRPPSSEFDPESGRRRRATARIRRRVAAGPRQRRSAPRHLFARIVILHHKPSAPPRRRRARRVSLSSSSSSSRRRERDGRDDQARAAARAHDRGARRRGQ